ncbi:hypothetical protein F8388_025634 [Cannabis sativa]|uniref:GDSL esterase/lipase n=1 Tax=Cannabis sativa TaxID=3483 RepID=A0A7J6G188_CANSA|nr:hypothetical protein F8388_025634 [Cannabis sativa]
MDLKSIMTILVILVILVKNSTQQRVPAVFLFGDSTMDVGNNNNLPTLVKSNFLPYGRDFNHTPTGRFSNGKLAIDFLVKDQLLFETYQVAYLSNEAKIGSNILSGANFASAGSGYSDTTANLYFAVSLSKQLEYFEEYQARIVGMVGEANASSILSNSIYVISSGTSDFVQNYYISPVLQLTYPNIQQFFNVLLTKFIFDGIELYHGVVCQGQSPYLGFFETRKGCCGSGLLETSLLCNELSIGTCSNASDYVFWDAFHPSQTANTFLAQNMIQAGISLLYPSSS